MVREKKVVDSVSGWLTVFDDGTVDRTWTGPPAVKFMADPVAPHADFIDGVATRDVIIDQDSCLRVRIYLPENFSGEKLPVLLHFHGGGFCITEADCFMYYNVYKRLALEARVICVSVYLRRAPEHRLPAACEDGYSALMWLKLVAQGKVCEAWLNAHADFKRVFLIGDSSGGNIVHQVASRAGEEDQWPLRLTGAIPIHPGFCRPERSRSELEKPESPFLTLDMVDKFIKLALPEGSNKNHPITCPMGFQAPAIDGLKLPPYLLCIAEEDLIIDTEMEFFEAMKKANKDVELFVNPGVGHSFYLNKIAVDMDPNTGVQTQRLILRIKEFINKH
ncbi:hypothetical protein LguiA_010696 [Lonicera macranthoides]